MQVTLDGSAAGPWSGVGLGLAHASYGFEARQMPRKQLVANTEDLTEAYVKENIIGR